MSLYQQIRNQPKQSSDGVNKSVSSSSNMSWISSIIGVLGGAASNAMNNAAIARENRRNRDFAHNEAILAHERQMQLQADQNNWNSPANQRRLLKEGGYNPNALFDGGATSISSGSVNGAQASNPSTFAPQSIMDPSSIAQLVTAFSNAKLNDAQAKVYDKQADLVGSQTLGQNLQNAYDYVRNSLFNQYGELQIKTGLNEQDSRTALNDAERLLIRTQQSLNIDELVTQRPLQAARQVADTFVANTQGELNEILQIKNKTERELSLKRFDLEVSIAAAAIARDYATAYNQRIQGDLYQPGEVGYNFLSNQSFLQDWLGKNQKFKTQLNYRMYQDFYDQFSSQMRFILSQRYGSQTGSLTLGGRALGLGSWSSSQSSLSPNPIPFSF